MIDPELVRIKVRTAKLERELARVEEHRDHLVREIARVNDEANEYWERLSADISAEVERLLGREE